MVVSKKFVSDILSTSAIGYFLDIHFMFKDIPPCKGPVMDIHKISCVKCM